MTTAADFLRDWVERCLVMDAKGRDEGKMRPHPQSEVLGPIAGNARNVIDARHRFRPAY